MISRKKLLLFTFFFIACVSNTIAQKNLKPTYKWVGGIGIGNIFVGGDVSPLKNQLSEGLFIKRAFNKWIGIALHYNHGNAKGLNYKPAENFAKNPALADKYAAPYLVLSNSGPVIRYGYTSNNSFTPATKNDVVYYNYKTVFNSLSISTAANAPFRLFNLNFSANFNIGIGLLNYKTTVDALNSNGTNYSSLYKDVANAVGTSNNLNSKEIKNRLKNGMDKNYETKAESTSNPTLFSHHISIGLSYILNDRITIGVEFMKRYAKSDLLDGQRWQEQAYGDAVLTRDFDFIRYNNLNLSYSF
jgi:hypothetical protein